MKKPSKDLLLTLKGEAVGEASLRSAYFLSPQKHKEKVEALRKLEGQTKERVLEYFGKNDIEVPSLWVATTIGTLLGFLLPLIPWTLAMKKVLPVADKGIEVFRRMELQASEGDKEFFAYVVAHEVAIRRFAEMELEGSEQSSLEPVTALLEG